MPKFRKKPVEIEARQFDGTQGSAKAVCAWMAAYGCEALRAFCGHDEPYQVYISTLEGRMTASAGDWIIRGVKGEFYPCKPDIFAATYEDAAIALMRGQSEFKRGDKVVVKFMGGVERNGEVVHRQGVTYSVFLDDGVGVPGVDVERIRPLPAPPQQEPAE